MLVFNCTQAAADFFTVIRNGKKLSCLEPVPETPVDYFGPDPDVNVGTIILSYFRFLFQRC